MRPSRPRRDWLARALRAAADRLAATPAPADRAPDTADPAPAVPRRHGEPPEHWLRVVAAHAPGLLHDLPHPTPATVDQADRVGSAPFDDADLVIDGHLGGDGGLHGAGGLDRNGGEDGPRGGVAAGEGRTAEGLATTWPRRPSGGLGRSRSVRTRRRSTRGNGRVLGEPGRVSPGTDRGGRSGAGAGVRAEDGGAWRSGREGDPQNADSARPGATERRQDAGPGASGRGRDADGWNRQAGGWGHDAERRSREGDGRRTDGGDRVTDRDGTDDLAGGVNGRSGAGRPRARGARATGGAPGAGGVWSPRSDPGDEPARPRSAPDAVASVPDAAGPDAARWPGRTEPRAGGPADRPTWPGGTPDGTTGSGREPDGLGPATMGRRSDRLPRAGLRVQLSSLEAQQTHPNGGAAGSTGPAPESSGATRAPWPALPGETTAPSGPAAATGDARPPRDPWPALPDDRELWRPSVGPTELARLRRLDREQAGE